MSQSDSDSPSSSVESSPNVPRRFLPLYLLKTLSPSKQALPVVSDSDHDSENESVPLPTSYYTSPSRPEKRRHLSVPSPKMAQLSIRGHARQSRSSIPGYGQGTKKTIRVSAARLNRSESTSSAGSEAFRRTGIKGAIPVSDTALLTTGAEAFRTTGIQGAVPVSDPALLNTGAEAIRRKGMTGAIPVSDPALLTSGADAPRRLRIHVVSPVSDPALLTTGSEALRRIGMKTAIPVSDMALLTPLHDRSRPPVNTRRTEGRCVQRLFDGGDPEKHLDGNGPKCTTPPGSPVSRFPIRRRVLLPRMKEVQMQYREPRIPIVVSDSDSSGDESENDGEEAPESVAISRVVSEILGMQPLEDNDESLFRGPVDVPSVTVGRDSDPQPDEPPVGFQEKDKPKLTSKKDKDRINRKDSVLAANLTDQKVKEIFKYPCCDSLCLREFCREEVAKQRTYYYGLTRTEKNVLLRGCMKQTHQGRTGYVVNGKSFCREGFKKLYSVGNDRLQKVSQDIFFRIQPETFSKEKSSTQLALVQWLNDFFQINVESLPNKDIFHLPDNWTKFEVFEAFKNETLSREETTLTYSWFCRIWNLEFPRVRIPKRSRFSTCAPCTEFKALRDKATLEHERSMFCFSQV